MAAGHGEQDVAALVKVVPSRNVVLIDPVDFFYFGAVASSR